MVLWTEPVCGILRSFVDFRFLVDPGSVVPAEPWRTSGVLVFCQNPRFHVRKILFISFLLSNSRSSRFLVSPHPPLRQVETPPPVFWFWRVSPLCAGTGTDAGPVRYRIPYPDRDFVFYSSFQSKLGVWSVRVCACGTSVVIFTHKIK